MEDKKDQNTIISFEQFSTYSDEKIGLDGVKLAQVIYQALMSKEGLLDFDAEGIELRDYMLRDKHLCNTVMHHAVDSAIKLLRISFMYGGADRFTPQSNPHTYVLENCMGSIIENLLENKDFFKENAERNSINQNNILK